MIKKEVIVEKNKKLTDFLQNFGFSYADVQKMLRSKDVRVDGKIERENVLLSSGQNVTFYYAQEMLQKRFRCVFESENVLIGFKSAGIETAGENGLEKALDVIAVHRLDRNTEGLVVFAKNEMAQKALETAFKQNRVHKFYLAEVVGKFEMKNKVEIAYLLKDSDKSEVKIFKDKVKGAVEIKTKFNTLKVGQTSLVEIELLTGKTHQIRAHLAFLGHAIVGDGKYGKNENNKKFQQKRQKLCCFRLKFDFIGLEELNFKTFESLPEWSNL